MFLPSYTNLRSVVFKELRRHTRTDGHDRKQNPASPLCGAQVDMHITFKQNLNGNVSFVYLHNVTLQSEFKRNVYVVFSQQSINNSVR